IRAGTVWSIKLSCDLTTGQITGDATGSSGVPIELDKDLGSSGHLRVRFVVDTFVPRSFARDIRPLFRDSDIRCMAGLSSGIAIDLTSYAAVQGQSESICIALNASETGQATHMPLGGWWP